MSLKKLPMQSGWLSRCYGSRRGLFVTLWHQLKYLAGGYRRYNGIDWRRVERLVFVCKGNICRSAVAEAVVGDAWPCASFGLQTVDDAPANVAARQVAADMGLDLQAHRTTSVEGVELRDGDLLVAMEPWQLAVLQQRFPAQQKTLLGLWMAPPRPHIQDPYGLSQDYFRFCFTAIEQAVQRLLDRLRIENGTGDSRGRDNGDHAR